MPTTPTFPAITPLSWADVPAAMSQAVDRWFAMYSPQRKSLAHKRYIGVVAIEVPDVDPLAWLQAQDFEESVYWRDREQRFECAGVGRASSCRSAATLPESIAMLQQHLDSLVWEPAPGLDTRGMGRFLGGMRFADKNDDHASHWQPWDTLEFSLPRFLLHKDKQGCLLYTHFTLDAALPHATQQEQLKQWWCSHLKSPSPVSSLPLAPLPLPQHAPDLPGWTAGIQRAQCAFHLKDLHKIVLARETCYAPYTQQPFPILESLRARSQQTFVFYTQSASRGAFFGATPERLYRRQGDRLISDALAGTRPRGQTPEEDRALGQELTTSIKEQHEHQVVLRRIQRTLQQFCDRVETPILMQLRQLRHVQHLWSLIEGRLKPGINDQTLLSALHPTPAVGGEPREQALALIPQIEGFDRGWYAAPIGWISPEGADFGVGIRSAQWNGQQLCLYAGAGIVPDSIPDAEWRELNQKLSPFLTLWDSDS